jgi:L-lactate dehydrogenase (cytochrome)
VDLNKAFPSIGDLEQACLRRIPRFASEYLRGGIGREVALNANRSALDGVQFDAHYIPEGDVPPVGPQTRVLGQEFALPFGISPVGLSGLMWPGAVEILAKAAAKANIPMGLSHHATTHQSAFRALAGSNGWFQLYPARDDTMRRAMIQEARDTGFETLIVTVDIPGITRRDRELRVGLSVPPKLNHETVWQVMTHPRWAVATALYGAPQFKNLLPYRPKGLSAKEQVAFFASFMDRPVSRKVLDDIRAQWPGKLVVKGISAAADAHAARDCRADAIWVSNHGARQLDAAPPSLVMLQEVRQALGKSACIFVDSGPRTGLDIARMLACGADFVFLGRPFIYGVGALGRRGGDHAIHILRDELRAVLVQLNCATPQELGRFLRR